MSGLARVEEIYNNRSVVAEELQSKGNKIFGYFCCYTPVEILTAASVVPFRIMGNVRQPITEADSYLEVIACPYTRSCLNLAVRGEYDFLEGFILPHACDNIVKLYDIWRHNIKPLYSHFINVPHTLSQPSHKFFEADLNYFKKSIESFTESEISAKRLNEAIELHNQNRALVRELYELRKPDPPLISGSEVIKILVAVMSLPVEEANDLLRDVIKDIESRENGPKKEPARLLVYGSEIDNTDFIEMIEESGANVVMDDLGVGARPFWHDVGISEEPVRELATRYLEKITCPRTFRGGEGSHQDDLEVNFGHLRDYARDFNANGAIIHVMRYCDTFALDLPDAREFLNGIGLPVIDIEDEYTVMSIQRLKTRVQAFTEMIG
ncbi:MAG: 2-hydroxyacyl-CoA dehydratase family protein [Chloroflexota bacterium]|nr:2-hydroxyacyl-CoA dehydratase family protein [Chloroflexota bacterium]